MPTCLDFRAETGLLSSKSKHWLESSWVGVLLRADTSLDQRWDQVKHQFLLENARKCQLALILEQKQDFSLQNPNTDWRLVDFESCWELTHLYIRDETKLNISFYWKMPTFLDIIAIIGLLSSKSKHWLGLSWVGELLRADTTLDERWDQVKHQFLTGKC